MSEYKFSKGDLLGPNDSDIYTAGIRVEEGGTSWGNRIEVYGKTAESAEALRDHIQHLETRVAELEGALDKNAVSEALKITLGPMQIEDFWAEYKLALDTQEDG